MADHAAVFTENSKDLLNHLYISEEKETTEIFYEKAEKYWSAIDPSINGVLGGYGWISSVDVRGSDRFLSSIFKSKQSPGKRRALDCGAGIGRVTKELLLRHFEKVDLVEQNAVFVEKARKAMGKEGRIGKMYVCSLRDFTLESKYDVIWCQWVLGHLTDLDLVRFFKRCADALEPNGVIVVKENISSEGVVMDDIDSSVTRPATSFLQIFKESSLRVVRHASQTNFPDGLFSVKLFALKPETTNLIPVTD